MQTALVAGGAGFIGGHLCEKLLSDGHKVICVDNFISSRKENISELLKNPNFKLLEHDVTDELNIDEDINYIFHLASPASPNHHSKISYHSLPLETMNVNTIGTFNLLNVAKKKNAKFLFTSTSEVYGDPLQHPQKEDYRGNVSTTGPRSVYDESKRFGETITAYFWRDGVDARIARIFNTYGPKMLKEDKRMIVDFILWALTDKPIVVFGDGTQTRSLCFVDDTVDGILKLMFEDGTNKQIVNIGSEEEHTVKEYAEIIKKLTNSKSEIVFGEKLPQDDPQKRRPDISRAKKILNWQPHTSLEAGLTKTIEYFRSL